MPKTKGAKRGRYGNNIVKSEFELLCSVMCTEPEICAYFNVDKATLNRWCHQEYGLTFTETWDTKASFGKISLRRIQFKQAQTNPTMAIFLGKQYLGQKDTIEETVSNRIEVVNDVPDVDV